MPIDIHQIGRLRSLRKLDLTPQITPAPTTTNLGRILNTALIGNPTSVRGLALGKDERSGSGFYHDVFTAYADKRITGPNVTVLGGLGLGKSTLIKLNYVLLPLMLRDRRCVVVDKKPRGNEVDGDGEYSELSRAFGAEPFTLLPGDPSSTCLNPLDPVVLMGGGRAAAASLLRQLAELASPDEGPLSTFEQKALRVAHGTLLKDFEGGRVPVLPDLLERFVGVVDSPEFAGRRLATFDQIDVASLNVQLRLESLCGDDLAGMFDRETSPWVGLNPKLTTFNISNLPEDGPAASMAIAMVNAWLMGMLRRQRKGMKTTLAIEEAWHLLAVARGLRANAKLARALGLSIVSAFHHLSDVPEDSDGMALIRESQTVHLFGQDKRDDVAACVSTFGLDTEAEKALGEMGQGEHLVKIGQEPVVRIEGVLTAQERAWTETDEAMLTKKVLANV